MRLNAHIVVLNLVNEPNMSKLNKMAAFAKISRALGHIGAASRLYRPLIYSRYVPILRDR
jgi:hypothetical protein